MPLQEHTGKADRFCKYCKTYDFPVQRDQASGTPEAEAAGTLRSLRTNKRCPRCRLLWQLLIHSSLFTDDFLYTARSISKRRVATRCSLPRDSPVYVGALDRSNLQEPWNVDLVVDDYLLRVLAFARANDKTLQNGALVHRQYADTSILKSWINNEIKPKFENVPAIVPENVNLHFIDVIKKQLVRIDHPVRYLALSYVWGSGPKKPWLKQVELVQDKDSDSKRDSANGVRHVANIQMAEIPLTILDAINVTREIGETYLWCDALCIPTDDARQRSAQIDSMDCIYQGAHCTLVCMTGTNANSGIPGTRNRPRRSFHISERASNRSTDQIFLELEDFPYKVFTSPWASRSWTLQESILSPNKIIFTMQQSYFASSEKDVFFPEYDNCAAPFIISNEYYISKFGGGGSDELFFQRFGNSSVHAQPDYGMFNVIQIGFEFNFDNFHIILKSICGSNYDPAYSVGGTITQRNESNIFEIHMVKCEHLVHSYGQLAHLYSMRSMSRAIDALNAFKGVLNRMKTERLDFFCGIPVSVDFTEIMGYGLLWSEFGKQTPHSKPEGWESISWPTWTWVGHWYPIIYPHLQETHLYKYNFRPVFSIRIEDGSVMPLRDWLVKQPRRVERRGISHSRLGGYHLLVKAVSFKVTLPIVNEELIIDKLNPFGITVNDLPVFMKTHEVFLVATAWFDDWRYRSTGEDFIHRNLDKDPKHRYLLLLLAEKDGIAKRLGIGSLEVACIFTGFIKEFVLS